MQYIRLDVETYSQCSLDDAGPSRYASDLTTGVFVVCFTPKDGPAERWLPGQPVPETIIKGAADPDTRFVAHSAAFEAAVWDYILVPKHGWPALLPDKWECSMAQARAIALPGKLEKLGEVLELDVQKDMEGAALMRDLATGEEDPTPENIERLAQYWL